MSFRSDWYEASTFYWELMFVSVSTLLLKSFQLRRNSCDFWVLTTGRLRPRIRELPRCPVALRDLKHFVHIEIKWTIQIQELEFIQYCLDGFSDKISKCAGQAWYFAKKRASKSLGQQSHFNG